jgi:hypothetical protein
VLLHSEVGCFALPNMKDQRLHQASHTTSNTCE